MLELIAIYAVMMVCVWLGWEAGMADAEEKQRIERRDEWLRRCEPSRN